MSLVNYSPWQDAAQYGAGLGNTLGQVLLSIPLKRAEFERDRNRDRLNDNVQNAHARYFDSLTAAMPDKTQATKDRDQEKMLHDVQIEEFLRAKAENFKADTASKDAIRKANIAKINANIPYIGPLANALIALRGASGNAAQMRATMAPENAASSRLTANANAALAGAPGLPNIDPSQIRLPQMPMQDPMAHAVQAATGMGSALPPPPQMQAPAPITMGGMPLGLPTPSLATPGNSNELGTAIMPPAAKRFILRENNTGKRFMGEQADIDANPGRFTIMDVAQ